jgi:hypothetical protein
MQPQDPSRRMLPTAEMKTRKIWFGGPYCNRAILQVIEETLHHIGEPYSFVRLKSPGNTLAIRRRIVDMSDLHTRTNCFETWYGPHRLKACSPAPSLPHPGGTPK